MPVFLFLIPGVIALVLKQRGEIHWDSPDQAFPVLMSNLLPSGLSGLVAAGLLAALMSSLASVFNSCSTLFTVDIYKKLRPDTPEKKLVNVGRIATLIVVVLGVLWIPIMANISGILYEYLQKVQSYIAPPIAAVFLLGVFHKRINQHGAFVTLLLGLIIGTVRITLELAKNFLDEGGLLYQFATINFLTFGAYFFLFSVILLVGVSLATPAQSEEQVRGLTFGTLTEDQKTENKNSYNWVDVVASLIVVGVVIYVMTTFTT